MEKLRRIEALHARPGSEGERHAAERARERIQARLKELEAYEPPIEFRFSLADQWSRHLFVALLRNYSPAEWGHARRSVVHARATASPRPVRTRLVGSLVLATSHQIVS